MAIKWHPSKSEQDKKVKEEQFKQVAEGVRCTERFREESCLRLIHGMTASKPTVLPCKMMISLSPLMLILPFPGSPLDVWDTISLLYYIY